MRLLLNVLFFGDVTDKKIEKGPCRRPECDTPLETPKVWTGTVEADLPPSTAPSAGPFAPKKTTHIAFPPDGEYELFVLAEKKDAAPAARELLFSAEEVWRWCKLVDPEL